MILPTKYENLKENSLVIGAHIISFLKQEELTINEIHLKLIKLKNADVDWFYLVDTLTFLYLADIIEIDSNNLLRLKK
jgi:hypothetical protein